MNIFDHIACWFCSWRTRRNDALAEKYAERACKWGDRHLHFAIRHMIEGKPNTKDVSDPPFNLPDVQWLSVLEAELSKPADQRAREAGA